MTDYKTLRVPEYAWEEAKAQKEEHDRTWGEQLVCSNNATTESESVGGTVVDADEIARKVEERLQGSKPLAEMEFEDWFEPDYAKTIATHISSEIALSDVAVDHSEVLNRIDDLENTLPRKTAEEIKR